MIDQTLLRFVCEIMEQHGRVHEIRKQLRSVKKQLDAIGEPEPDYYCTMFPDEHGEDHEYYENLGKKERLSELFARLLNEKISQEKLLKKMKYQFHDYQRDYIESEEHIDLDVLVQQMVRDRTERVRQDLRFKSQTGEVLGQIILNIISITYKRYLYKFVTQDINDFGRKMESMFQRAENSYYRKVSGGNKMKRFKVANYMASTYITDEQVVIDIIFNAMNIASQITKGLENEPDEDVVRKATNYAENLQRLIYEYDSLCKTQIHSKPLKSTYQLG